MVISYESGEDELLLPHACAAAEAGAKVVEQPSACGTAARPRAFRTSHAAPPASATRTHASPKGDSRKGWSLRPASGGGTAMHRTATEIFSHRSLSAHR